MDNQEKIQFDNSGSYEIIQKRLGNQAEELTQRLENLNQKRKETFGAIETKLISTEHITTTHNCIPRDMVEIGKHFIFGYNVQLLLKEKYELSDVFGIYEFSDNKFHIEDLSFIQDETFQIDFDNLFKYYKNTFFAKFHIANGFLFMIFQTSQNPQDIKAFKWAIHEQENQKVILQYIDNRSEHEIPQATQYAFTWKKTNRDNLLRTENPKMSINDKVFIHLEEQKVHFSVENNTKNGQLILTELLETDKQRLEDIEIYYADFEEIVLLKIRPQLEDKFRFYIYNHKLNEILREDSIRESCIALPEDHGIIFPNGFYLKAGKLKTFPLESNNMRFEQLIPADNGEDYLFIFFNQQLGTYLLLQYNIIAQNIENPILCHGYSLFPDGELAFFRADTEAKKHHNIQIWQTPFVGKNYISKAENDTFLSKIGNKEIVQAMAECHEIIVLIHKDEVYQSMYLDLVEKTARMLDAYHWFTNQELFNLAEILSEIKETAFTAIEEFEKVVQQKQNAKTLLTDFEEKFQTLHKKIRRIKFENINEFVAILAELRQLRGELITLKETKYIDLEAIKTYEVDLNENNNILSEKCVDFLLQDHALNPYLKTTDEQAKTIEQQSVVFDLEQTIKNINQTAQELDLLIDIVSNLKFEDSTKKTEITDKISDIYAIINRNRSNANNKKKSLSETEAVNQFNAELKLLNQSFNNFLELSDTPQKTEEFLSKLMIQLEDMEGKFAEFEQFIEQINIKREDIYNAFESKKLLLVEKRNKKTNALESAANRILNGIKNKAESYKTINEINAYFAADIMVDKVRNIIKDLIELEDSVKADKVQSKLKSTQENAIRQLKDKNELFVDGENIIKFGEHHFSVNTQKVELTTLLRNNSLQVHITGTNFFETIKDDALEQTKSVWEQEIISENKKIARAEFLAYQFIKSHKNYQLHEKTLDDIIEFMSTRYEESYTKGVHEQDAFKIIEELVKMEKSLGLLRFQSDIRTAGNLFWNFYLKPERKSILESKILSLGKLFQVFPNTGERQSLIEELKPLIQIFIDKTSVFSQLDSEKIAEYLFFQLNENQKFIIDQKAVQIQEVFENFIQESKNTKTLNASLEHTKQSPIDSYKLLYKWIKAFIQQNNAENNYLSEASIVAFLKQNKQLSKTEISEKESEVTLTELVSAHQAIQNANYTLNYHDFYQKLQDYEQNTLPKFKQYQTLRKNFVEEYREKLRLNEFQPRVLTSFVRNQLIDKVYLPILGDNLAKQIGTAGENKRTDLMGMLLLISPPGYGKTTLMEYIAKQLGIIFMKINGPAIGHEVKSLDPQEAPNATAREELQKLNLAFEMGDNIMIYLDDIQHCNAEFLQKFISLSDGQRKIEGVYKGKTKTYDLRGRKVAVIMAGNPYTESGEKFQIPDMLANRADIYNLGDILGDSENEFKLSYIENSLSSNPTLATLRTKSKEDIYTFVKIAQNPNLTAKFESNYSATEIQNITEVMKKMLQVRDIVFRVNMEYIYSAGQEEQYRTEPPFKLQGSYRDMNKLSAKILPIMNEKELWTMILSHYENESQTLTTGAEANFLKLKAMFDKLDEEESTRWQEIKTEFKKQQQLKGLGKDAQMSQVLLELGNFNQGIKGIKEALEKRE